MKETRQDQAAELLGRAAEFVMPGTLSLGLKLVSFLSPYNLIVTNIPGPDVPLFEKQGVGIAIFSYDDSLCFGFNADWDLVPDLEELSEAVSDAFAELHAVAVQDALKVRSPARRTDRDSAPAST